MKKVYLDNAATSFPKPDVVVKAMHQMLLHTEGSSNRSYSSDALLIERGIYETRSALCAYFNFDHVDHVVFTKNITESLNLVLMGFLEAGDKVVTTCLEHNAVIRPLEHLSQVRGVRYTCVPLTAAGTLDLDQLERQLEQKPKLMVSTCASNLTGDVLPIETIGEMCHRYGVPFLVDTAQMAGVLPIDMKAAHIDLLAFTGHKSLLGPQGVGGVLMNPSLAPHIRPLLYGGTGSLSESLEQPELMPDKFESGTANAPAIMGLGAGVAHLMAAEDSLALYRYENALIKRLQEGVENMSGVRVLGQRDASKRLGVLALDFERWDNAAVAFELSKAFGISTRVGLHCAPLAHRAYNSFPQGAVRFSVSGFTTIEEIDYTIEAIKRVLKV